MLGGGERNSGSPGEEAVLQEYVRNALEQPEPPHSYMLDSYKI